MKNSKFVDICKSHGLNVMDITNEDNSATAYLSTSLNGWVARHSNKKNNKILRVAKNIICDDGILCGRGYQDVTEEMFEKELDKLMQSYKILKKELRRQKIEEL